MAKIPLNRTFDNLTGKRFNRLTVLSYEGQVSGSAAWRAKCDCGTEKVVKRKNLLSGKQQSCGCFRSEHHPMKTHGLYGTPEHSAWGSMKGRCLNPRDKRYPYYGGRGISIHPSWVDSFESFLSHIGLRPTSEHSLDRIDTDGNYEPGNVRWADNLTQRGNKRVVAVATINGETKPIPEWARKYGVKPKLVYHRMRKLGWDLHRALTTDPSEYRSRGTPS